MHWRLNAAFLFLITTFAAADIGPEPNRLEHTQEPRLTIEPNQEDQLLIGASKSYLFAAYLEAATTESVALLPPLVANNWSAVLMDSAGVQELPDTDGDGAMELDPIPPQGRRYFTLRVTAPTRLSGDTSHHFAHRFLIQGFLLADTAVRDTALLQIKLVPGLDIHNFPNPFAGQTTFILGLPEDGRVTLTVYNRSAEQVVRLLASEPFRAGVHLINWNGKNNHNQPVAPGTYHCLLEYEHRGRVERIKKKIVCEGRQ